MRPQFTYSHILPQSALKPQYEGYSVFVFGYCVPLSLVWRVTHHSNDAWCIDIYLLLLNNNNNNKYDNEDNGVNPEERVVITTNSDHDINLCSFFVSTTTPPLGGEPPTNIYNPEDDYNNYNYNYNYNENGNEHHHNRAAWVPPSITPNTYCDFLTNIILITLPIEESASHMWHCQWHILHITTEERPRPVNIISSFSK